MANAFTGIGARAWPSEDREQDLMADIDSLILEHLHAICADVADMKGRVSRFSPG
jgi:hypothetical protein